MKGSIRVFVGILTLIGVAGGLDNATDAQIPTLLAIAVVGGLIALSGVSSMRGSV